MLLSSSVVLGAAFMFFYNFYIYKIPHGSRNLAYIELLLFAFMCNVFLTMAAVTSNFKVL